MGEFIDKLADFFMWPFIACILGLAFCLLKELFLPRSEDFIQFSIVVLIAVILSPLYIYMDLKNLIHYKRHSDEMYIDKSIALLHIIVYVFLAFCVLIVVFNFKFYDPTSPSVYVTEHGKKYHTAYCYQIEDKEVDKLTITLAEKRGYTPCANCH